MDDMPFGLVRRVPSSYRLKLYFAKPAHDLDALTLARTLVETEAIIRQVNLGSGNHFVIRLAVRPFRPGSFDVPVDLIPIIQGSLFAASECYTQLKYVVTLASDLLKLRKFLGGKKPERVTPVGHKRVEVHAHDNATVIVHANTLNIYECDDATSAAITRQFDQLERDPSIQSFSVKPRRGKTLVEVPREDFRRVAAAPPTRRRDIEDEVQRLQLCIVKPVLEAREASWEFIAREEKVFAKMGDPDFLARIETGEKFAMGDRLDADVRLRKEFDTTLQIYRVTGREVIHVYNHTPRPHQLDLETG